MIDSLVLRGREASVIDELISNALKKIQEKGGKIIDVKFQHGFSTCMGEEKDIPASSYAALILYEM